MRAARAKTRRSNEQRKGDALVAAGIAPSRFGKRKPGQPHRDRQHAAARGERKHKRPWD
jgi:hypothetical protein